MAGSRPLRSLIGTNTSTGQALESFATMEGSVRKRKCCLDNKFERFCCCFDIRTGTVVIGVYEVFSIAAIATKATLLKMWWLYAGCVFPMINLFFFYKWTKKDNVTNRKRFYYSLLLCYLSFLAYWITLITLEFNLKWHERACENQTYYQWLAGFECLDLFLAFELAAEFVLILLQTYFVLIARQNWINLRDGYGDMREKDDLEQLML